METYHDLAGRVDEYERSKFSWHKRSGKEQRRSKVSGTYHDLVGNCPD
jgi:hypothetical protein